MSDETQGPEAQDEVQLQLLPDKPPKPKGMRVKVWALPKTYARPVAEWVRTMPHTGVFQSVALVQTEDGYRWADGRKRGASVLAAYDQFGAPDDVPALVFSKGTPLRLAAAITLMANLQRHESPASEMEAIEQIMADGITDPKVIARDLGVPVQTIQKRLALQALAPELRTALDEGRIYPSVAERAAKLDPERQRKLVGILEEKGTVIGHDVAEAKKVRQAEAVALLPDDVFESPSAEEAGGAGPFTIDGSSTIELQANGSPWYPLRVTLEHSLELVPDGEDELVEESIRSLVTSALDHIGDVEAAEVAS